MSTTIPVPDNPQHIDNLASIELLEAQGFEGSDASLAESLFCYGLAWREVNGELLIIYGIQNNSAGKWCRFDRATISPNVDVSKEWNFADFPAVAQCSGESVEDWSTKPLMWRIDDLIRYYGFENIFGSCYWEGFAIAE